MKNTAETQRRASDMLADYLNGHLTESDRQYVESVLASDASLKEQLLFEESLKVALRTESELVETRVTTSDAGFDAIADRIEPQRHPIADAFSNFLEQWRWLAVAAPVAAVVLMLSMNGLQQGPVAPVQEFETAFDDKANYEAPTLLVLFEEPPEESTLAEFLAMHDLSLIDNAAVGPMLELRPQDKEANLRAVATKIEDYPRVLAVKLLGAQP
ncbi:MAG: hypothetical protein AAF749_10200 [Pseudomonadota bacterium]